MKKVFKIKGMHCNSCAQRIEDKLKDKVNKISVSYAKERAEIDFDSEKISEKEIKEVVRGCGYEPDGKEVKKDGNQRIGFFVMIGSLLVLAYFVYQWISGLNLTIPGVGESSGILLLFFVGLLTGFHCVSMCGGFVVGYTTKNAEQGHKGFKQHFVYGGAKIVSYAVIGGIFGLIGGVFAFSVGLRGAVAIFAGLFMIAFALSMLGVGFFKRFQFNPKFLSRWTSKTTRGSKGFYKAPFMTGILSGLFIACGPLQAMYLYAAGTGSFLIGLFSLAAFGLGTLPIMIGFGSLTSVISKKATKRILKIAAILVLVLGLIMLNRGLTVMGSSVSYDSIKDKIIGVDSGSAVLVEGVQEINMEVNRYGWEPESFVLKKGVPVKWNINVLELTGCNNEIFVRDYGLEIKLKKGLNVVEFTPDEAGTVRWSCWMGMIPGSFVVTETGEASQEQIKSATPVGGGSCSGGAGGGSCGSPTCGSTTGSGGCGCGG
ncbi:heavy metal transporter [Candidatus Pacearchaeota archaeon]|nr:heavy metal transporter [Candidatus Pacearchaeota archaeon]|tara:strand:- start:3179 stop:4636 length:1458 start_codon:yes stop_codon:yes gene_type:complete